MNKSGFSSLFIFVTVVGFLVIGVAIYLVSTKKLQQQGKEARSKSTDLRGEFQLLGVEDIRILVGRVVKRELEPDSTEGLLRDINIPWLRR